MEKINIGIIGTQFMGRAHSNAYMDVNAYYKLGAEVVMRASCDINLDSAKALSDQYGWESQETSYTDLLKRTDIDVVDICTSNASHMPIAAAAAKAGKHVICEKPIAMNAEEALKMYHAAEEAGVKHMTAFNYRRVPAIALAKKMIEEGKLGKIHHFNAVYYQDWLVDPNFPMVWRHDTKVAGSGAHGDMNAHTVDLARFLLGEFESVCGEEKIFIEERPIANSDKTGRVSADDATSFLARFKGGAIGNFLATRFATGKKNFLRLEIFGSEGSIVFNLERLNELQFYSRNEAADEQGFRNIIVTESSHPYLNKWWPPGHIIGWEHTFIHEIGDFLTCVVNNKPVQPDFYDGYRCQLVLDAVSQSAREQKWIEIPETKRL